MIALAEKPALHPTSSDAARARLAETERLGDEIATLAAQPQPRTVPSPRHKGVTPHVLRYTVTVQLRHVGVDLSVIALWLGHESIETTHIYLDADLDTKEAAVSLLAPVHNGYRRYRATDDLLDFLNCL